MKRWNLIVAILTCVTMAGVIIGWAWNHDQSLARASSVTILRTELKLLQKTYEEDRKLQRARDLDERIWVLKMKYEGKQMPQDVREYLYRMEAELAELRRK